jgi:hypothetical protein
LGTNGHRVPRSVAILSADSGCLNFLYRRNKPVSAAGQGFNVSRHLGRIAQDFTKACNCVVKAMVEIDKGIGRPDFGPKFFARDQIAGTLQQGREHLKRLTVQAQLYAAFP